jgi:hypothetical protein
LVAIFMQLWEQRLQISAQAIMMTSSSNRSQSMAQARQISAQRLQA